MHPSLAGAQDANLKPAFTQPTATQGVPFLHMRSRLILPIAVLSALLLAAPASANFRVGLSEQNPQMFLQPAWQALKLKRVRYIVPWDWYKYRGQRSEVEFFMGTARLFKQDVLATFTADRS